MKHPGAKFEPGDVVQIADRKTLDEFLRSWKLHHPLEPEQLEYALRLAKVSEARMYHGGDILYALEGVPGVWHQRLVDFASE